MSDKMYTVVRKQIVKAANMTHARNIADGYEDFPGELMSDELNTELSNQKVSSNQTILIEDSSDLEVPTFNDRGDFLRSENRRLARLADKYKNVKDEAVVAIYEAAYDAFSTISLPPVKKPVLKSGLGEPETAVAVFADWQLGKVTPDYNSNVAAQRIELYTEKLLEITEIQRKHHPVNNLHVWMLGDIVEGEEIFPGQAHLIDSGLYRQVGVNGPEIIAKFLRTALENFEHVHVTGVIGNHGAVGGRGRKQHDPETNMDRLLYQIIRLIFKDEPRITFNIPDGKGERHWYAVDTIGNYSSLLIHGDQLPSPNAFHGYYKKIMGWKDGAIPEHFDDVFMGH